VAGLLLPGAGRLAYLVYTLIALKETRLRSSVVGAPSNRITATRRARHGLRSPSPSDGGMSATSAEAAAPSNSAIEVLRSPHLIATAALKSEQTTEHFEL
jgi:hypothetical protein